MKITNQTQLAPRGYAVLMTTLSLSLTIMAFAIVSFQGTRQAHRVQSAKQVRQDYSQKERALLRALLDVAPNAMMQNMMSNSAATAANTSWATIFQNAIDKARTDIALNVDDAALLGNLGITVDVISSNTGNTDFDPLNLVKSPADSSFVFTDTETPIAGLSSLLPPSLQFESGTPSFAKTHPVISFEKSLNGLNGTARDLYTQLDYPDISFGYTAQDSTFIAKRNWWAFTLNFGEDTRDITGIAPASHTYVLSVYEVPSQLAVSSSSGTTSLGQFAGGASWTTAKNMSIQGNIHVENGRIEDTSQVGTVSSRKGLTLGNSAPSGQAIGGTAERRQLRATTTTNEFHAYSSSADSGLVSFTPINQGAAYFDFFQGETSLGLPNPNNPQVMLPPSPGVINTISPTNWDEYSIGAKQAKLRIEVSKVAAAAQLPQEIYISAQTAGVPQRQRYARGELWNRPGQPATNSSVGGDPWPSSPPGDDWFVQTEDLRGRPCITLDLEKLPAFLLAVGMDPATENNTIWIGPNHLSNDPDAPREASFPSLADDMALIIKKSTDLSAYAGGLSIVTPLRVYFDDNFNDIAATPPAGSGITGTWYPPVSVFAPEKRFGTTATGGDIQIQGRVGVLPNDSAAGSDVNPLDLRDGEDGFSASNIDVNLSNIDQKENLPPINSMSWLTVIERVN